MGGRKVTSHVKDIARFYLDHYGLNVVPVKTKQPLVEWKKFQTEKQSPEVFEALPWAEADGFALIGGSQTKQDFFLGCLDFDVKSQSLEAQAKGREASKHVRITQAEQTPSGGQHWVYFSEKRPKSVSAYLGVAALELLGENKLIIMAPSRGYVRLNDNVPTEVSDLEALFYSALRSVGVRVEEKRALGNSAVSKLPRNFKDLDQAEEEKIIQWLSRYWVRGFRDRLTMSFLGYAVKSGISEPSAYRIIDAVTLRCGDEEREARLAQVSYHYCKLDQAQRFIGSSGLREVIKAIHGAT